MFSYKEKGRKFTDEFSINSLIYLLPNCYWKILTTTITIDILQFNVKQIQKLEYLEYITRDRNIFAIYGDFIFNYGRITLDICICMITSGLLYGILRIAS